MNIQARIGSPEALKYGRVVMLMSGLDNPVCIGSIFTNLDRSELHDLFDEWRAAVPEPDCDSDFVSWAVENNHRCSAVPFTNFEFMTITE